MHLGRVLNFMLRQVLEDDSTIQHLADLHRVVGGAQAVVRVASQNLAVREAYFPVSHDCSGGTGLKSTNNPFHQIRHRVRLTASGLAVRKNDAHLAI